MGEFGLGKDAPRLFEKGPEVGVALAEVREIQLPDGGPLAELRGLLGSHVLVLLGLLPEVFHVGGFADQDIRGSGVFHQRRKELRIEDEGELLPFHDRRRALHVDGLAFPLDALPLLERLEDGVLG